MRWLIGLTVLLWLAGPASAAEQELELSVAGRTTQGTDDTRTALQIFNMLRPNVRVRPWYKCDSAGASSRHRIMAIDATDPDGPRMVTPLEPTQGTPWRKINGWLVPIYMKTGGVQVNKREVIAYMDPVNQA